MASAAFSPKLPSRRSATRGVPQIRVLPVVSRAEAVTCVPSRADVYQHLRVLEPQALEPRRYRIASLLLRVARGVPLSDRPGDRQPPTETLPASSGGEGSGYRLLCLAVAGSFSATNNGVGGTGADAQHCRQIVQARDPGPLVPGPPSSLPNRV